VALSGQTSNIFVNIERKHIIMIALMTFFGLFITNIIYLKALKKTKNTHLVVVIMAMYPIVTLLLGLFILNEKLTTWGYIGFILVMMGIGIMIMSGEK
jgi:drug/metabolite transporter (DMT)-like permease